MVQLPHIIWTETDCQAEKMGGRNSFMKLDPYDRMQSETLSECKDSSWQRRLQRTDSCFDFLESQNANPYLCNTKMKSLLCFVFAFYQIYESVE